MLNTNPYKTTVPSQAAQDWIRSCGVSGSRRRASAYADGRRPALRMSFDDGCVPALFRRGGAAVVTQTSGITAVTEMSLFGTLSVGFLCSEYRKFRKLLYIPQRTLSTQNSRFFLELILTV